MEAKKVDGLIIDVRDNGGGLVTVGTEIADALMGEVTPAMAVAVGQSDAARILIPMNKCENMVAGVSNLSTSVLIQDAISKVGQYISNHC